MRSSFFVALAAAASTVSAVSQGFNYGSTQTDGSVKDQAAFQAEFAAAKGLVGTSGFTSARLYTMIQGGTTKDPISAIPAAIAEGTSLLLGMWASGGQTSMDNEIAALQSAISEYGSAFTSLVVGLSVGSEDLYRNSPTGIAANAGIGADAATIVSYIDQVRTAIKGTALSDVTILHVDTWTGWVETDSASVVTAVDALGTDAYPYFQDTMDNSIDDGATLFFSAYDATVAVAQGKDVWITETGWPVSGPAANLAEASTANAKTYWDDVACKVLGTTNTYWYTLQDAYPTTPSPSFGLVGSTLSTTPLYDLTCNTTSSSSSSSAASSATSASSAGSASAASSAVSSASLDAAGASSLAAAATPSGGLSPAQGAGNGVPSSAEASVAAASTDAAASVSSSLASASASLVPVYTNSTGVASQTAVGTAVSTGSGNGGSATTTASPTTFTGLAVANSGSIVGGVLGSLFAILAAF